MKMKKLGILVLMSLMFVLMTVGVNATYDCACIKPAATTAGTAAGYLRGAEINVSVNITGRLGSSGNVSDASIAVSAGTITGALSQNVTTGNLTLDNVNFTVSTLQLTDETAVTFTITLRNKTTATVLGTCNCPSSGSYYIDNTVPEAVLSSPADKSKDTDGIITPTYACDNTSSATLFIESGGIGYTAYTLSKSSNVCSYTNLRIPRNGFASHYIVSSDGLNTTTSAVSTVEIRKPGSDGLAEGATITGGTGTGTQSIFGGAGLSGLTSNPAGLLVIGGAAYLLLSDKKKKKKR